MWRILFGVVLGISVAPLVKRYRRPVLTRVVRAGVSVGRGVQQATARLKEDIEDAAAESASRDGAPGGEPAEP